MCADFAHILESRNIRPVLRQHGATVRVNLNLRDALHASAFKAKVESADTGEQADECQHAPPPISTARESNAQTSDLQSEPLAILVAVRCAALVPTVP